MPSFPKPESIKKRRTWLVKTPDWEWEAWKQAVYYPWLSSSQHIGGLFGLRNPGLRILQCMCDRCSSNMTNPLERLWIGLELLPHPDKYGNSWFAMDFDVHHVARRGSHPEDKFKIENCIPVHRECHRKEIH